MTELFIHVFIFLMIHQQTSELDPGCDSVVCFWGGNKYSEKWRFNLPAEDERVDRYGSHREKTST